MYNLDSNKTNYNTWNDIDIILDWTQTKVFILYNNNSINPANHFNDFSTYFYHESLSMGVTKPSKIILYNFSANSSCLIRNLSLCEEFCDIATQNSFKYLSTSFFHVISISLLLVIMISLF